MIIKQLAMGYMDNFSYVVGCPVTGKAMVIDPGPEVDLIIAAAKAADLTIETIFNTHGHGDHTAGNRPLKTQTGAAIIIHHLDAECFPDADRFLKDETTLFVGELKIDLIHTPGHTPGGVCLHVQKNLFTGDTLFVGDSGRTDLPGGHRLTLGASIRRLMALADDTAIWPGHDYGPTPTSTIGWEKANNVNAVEYGFYRKV
ncbi:MAG: MBL fold metallo-hydrolase [Desulfatitalea sp.]|nr:MBL fold metallo-hydrolase [Desulfatitalea sp.]NNJ98946.1 MBL fold metallo-hydrolase [Desulfatitalea sp.]